MLSDVTAQSGIENETASLHGAFVLMAGLINSGLEMAAIDTIILVLALCSKFSIIYKGMLYATSI